MRETSRDDDWCCGRIAVLLCRASLELLSNHEADCWLFQRSTMEGQLSNFMPRPRPIVERISLISFNDFRPKFLVLRMSCSVFCTSSPIRVMLAFCRQFAERTDSSSSSTERNRFSFSGSSSLPVGMYEVSSDSSKLIQIESCSLRILAAKATASTGRTAPLVQTSSTSLS